MTPCEECRRWLRQGAPFERGSAAIAAVIALALVAWVLVPSNDSNNGGGQVTAGRSASGQGATAGPGGSVGASGPGATAASGASTASAGGGPAAGTGTASGGNAALAGSSTAPVAGGAGSTCPQGATDQG